jgi:cyclophilin family peptidyl-prolyl cis-trans isomerase
MRRLLFVAALTALLPASLVTVHSQQPVTSTAPIVVFTMAKGVFEIETFPADAPKSVARFVDLAKHGFYRGQRFHWVQSGVVQVGDPQSRDMTKRDVWGKGGSGALFRLAPIGVAEISKRRFERGTVGLAYNANQSAEDADCQIFIVKVASPALNGKYAAIGHVTKGMSVVDGIALEDLIKDIAVR